MLDSVLFVEWIDQRGRTLGLAQTEMASPVTTQGSMPTARLIGREE